MSYRDEMNMGFAGKLASQFIHSKLTLVFVLFSILLGLLAVWITPKEEEPQISVPMIDIHLSSPGLTAEEVERKVTEVVERAMWGLQGVEYIYSTSKAHGALITVRFQVGQPMEPSLVKVHHQLMLLRQELPKNVFEPIVKSYSIDDVPFLAITFSSTEKSDYELRTLIAPLARELSSTPDLKKVELLGGQKRSVRVIAEPKKMASYGVSLLAVSQSLQNNDAFGPAGKTWGASEMMDVDVGGVIRNVDDLQNIAVGQRGGRIVRVRDVAKVVDGPEQEIRKSMLVNRDGVVERAVTITFAKRKGTNVVTLAQKITQKAQKFSQRFSSDVKINFIRNYGQTAKEKSDELVKHLLLATLSVSILIALVMGVRSALVVAIAIPVTLALTLAIYYFMGYTLNRVTLFALIFSIGILVDDAIVVVENIERHLHQDRSLGLTKATLIAVAEVGNPTILATFTVIAAILPMAFVRGLMGPYMKPIPVGASLAMIFSLFVAFIVTPWASVKILAGAKKQPNKIEKEKWLDRKYRMLMNLLLGSWKGAALFFFGTFLLFVGALSLVGLKIVKVKMLPFDNKNEFQVLIDYPPATTLEKNADWSKAIATEIAKDTNVENVQIFLGESAPFSFSGMVKHSFLRGEDFMSDLHVVLKDKHHRKKSSHNIIEDLRPLVADFAKDKNAVTKILEVPPGPPVLATLLAEVYGPDEKTRQQVGQELVEIFRDQPNVVDLDYSWRTGRQKLVYLYDAYQGGLMGSNAVTANAIGANVFSETPLLTLQESSHPEDIHVELSVAPWLRSSTAPFQTLVASSIESGSFQLQDVFQKPQVREDLALYRKNLKPVNYVMAELSGAEEAPVYGMLQIAPKITYPQQTAEVPQDTDQAVVKWDGEWFITYEVFRDLGGAFAVVMLLIYVLVLGWFKSFSIPLLIMAPIPISLIGILPGHWFTGAFFTATSMIGFIAGAGIIVRNSIILVDFIQHQLAKGMVLKEAVISAGVLRFRPMLLTAAAVVVGSSVMLFDPIFQGLAVSLIFGEVAATVLSRFAVPILFYHFGTSKQKEVV